MVFLFHWTFYKRFSCKSYLITQPKKPATVVAVTKLHASRPRMDFSKPPPPPITALLWVNCTALLALLCCEFWAVLTCLGFAVRVATLHEFAVTLKQSICCLLLYLFVIPLVEVHKANSRQVSQGLPDVCDTSHNSNFLYYILCVDLY
jgi:hypothetical protein